LRQERPKFLPVLCCAVWMAAGPACHASSVVGLEVHDCGAERFSLVGNMRAAQLIKRVTPMYPERAKARRIQGAVRLSAVIGRDGFLHKVQPLSGHPMLLTAAREAVEQWQYVPTSLDGNPVDVVTQIEVVFSLDNASADGR
jgi:TonB family protein